MACKVHLKEEPCCSPHPFPIMCAEQGRSQTCSHLLFHRGTELQGHRGSPKLAPVPALPRRLGGTFSIPHLLQPRLSAPATPHLHGRDSPGLQLLLCGWFGHLTFSGHWQKCRRTPRSLEGSKDFPHQGGPCLLPRFFWFLLF